MQDRFVSRSSQQHQQELSSKPGKAEAGASKSTAACVLLRDLCFDCQGKTDIDMQYPMDVLHGILEQARSLQGEWHKGNSAGNRLRKGEIGQKMGEKAFNFAEE